MYKYLDELKKREVIIEQMKRLQQELQTHWLTQHLVPRSHQEIIDYMIVNKLRNVDTYVRLCEMTGRCLGQTAKASNDREINLQFNIQLVQLELQKHKLKQQKQARKSKNFIMHINTPSTEVESIKELKQKLNSKNEKLQKVISEVRAKQTLRDKMKIEEYYQQKKIKKLQTIEGWVSVDQSRLCQPIKSNIVGDVLATFKKFCQQLSINFADQLITQQ